MVDAGDFISRCFVFNAANLANERYFCGRCLLAHGLLQDKPVVQKRNLATKYTYDLTGLSRTDKQAFQTAFATGYNDIQIINDLVKADGQLQAIADRYQFELFTDNILAAFFSL